MHDFCAILLRYNDHKGILRALFLCNVDFFLENRQNLWKKEFWVREVMSLVRLELKPPRSSTLEWIPIL